MSGICGIVRADPREPVDAERVSRMLDALDVGRLRSGRILVRGPVGFGAVGLDGCETSSVVATTVGDAEVLLAFHGALYGSGGPPSRGAEAASRLLSRYVTTGLDFVHGIAGDFCIALWDGRVPMAALFVDRFRVKPLFWRVGGGEMVFSSRLPALVAGGGAPVSLRLSGVLDVVGGSMIPTPRTIYREVSKLPAGARLEFSGGSASVSAYWDLSFLEPDGGSFEELAEKTRRGLRAAIRSRLDHDLPASRVGSFLSGGIDSSTVTGELNRLLGEPVDSFSIGFADAAYNEIQYARISARMLGAKPHEYFVTPGDVVAALEVLATHFDEPYANSSAVPVLHCARLAREVGVDVLYAGDAGDELFAGNKWYATQRVFERWDRIPRWPRDVILGPAIEALGTVIPFGIPRKARKYVERASTPLPERLTSYGFYETVPLSELYEPDFLRTAVPGYRPHEALFEHYERAPARDELDKRLYVDMKLVITDNDVPKVGRMAHAAGIGVRFPFLDHAFASLAASVPARMKMSGTELRTFFKRAYAGLLPREVIEKKKHGFGLPVPDWLRTDPRLNEIMRDLVLGRVTRERGIYRAATLEKLVERHRTDPTPFYGTALWHLMTVESWMRRQQGPHAA